MKLDLRRKQQIIEKANYYLRLLDSNKPPINLQNFIRLVQEEIDKEIYVKGEDLSPNHSGQIIKVDKVIGILYNLKHPKTRRRFTIAHELGHLVLKHIFPHTTYTEIINFKTKAKIEVEANIFSANFLMPESLMKNVTVKTMKEVKQLAEKFWVSYDAMNFKICSNNKYTGLKLDKTDYFQKKFKQNYNISNVETNLRQVEEGSYDDFMQKAFGRN